MLKSSKVLHEGMSLASVINAIFGALELDKQRYPTVGFCSPTDAAQSFTVDDIATVPMANVKRDPKAQTWEFEGGYVKANSQYVTFDISANIVVPTYSSEAYTVYLSLRHSDDGGTTWEQSNRTIQRYEIPQTATAGAMSLPYKYIAESTRGRLYAIGVQTTKKFTMTETNAARSNMAVVAYNKSMA